MGIKKRKEKGILSPKELDFIQFSTEDHIRLVSNGFGAMWANDIHAETKLIKVVVEKLSADKRLTAEDFWVLELAMAEHSDVATDGEGGSACFYCRERESSQSTHVLRKIVNKYLLPGLKVERLL